MFSRINSMGEDQFDLYVGYEGIASNKRKKYEKKKSFVVSLLETENESFLKNLFFFCGKVVIIHNFYVERWPFLSLSLSLCGIFCVDLEW